jgi:molecular chaperone DnaK (HSP70)
MTIMPVIAETLKERFGLDGRQQDPQLAVAKGAALFALMKKVKVTSEGDSDAQGVPASAQEVAERLGLTAELARAMVEMQVATVVPRAFGLNVVDGRDPLARTDPDKARHYIKHLLTANTPLPADTGPQTFRTLTDNQSEVALEVFEQAGAVASEDLENNTKIGEGLLSDLPPRPAGAPFQVVFHMTETGLLQVHGREADSGREVRFQIQIGRLDEAAMQRATNAVAHYEVSG